MRSSKIVPVLIISLILMVTFQAHAMNSKLVLKEMTIGEVAWAPGERMLVAKPFVGPAYLIYKVNTAWEIKPTDIRGNAKYFKWSHKGDRFLYWLDGSLYQYKPAGESISVITDAAESEPDWSPNDKYLAYIYDKHVWRVTPDLKQRKRLTKKPVVEAIRPQWSKSGKEIVFQGAYKGGYTMWKVNTVTGATKVINDKAKCVYYKWRLWNDRILVVDETTTNFKQLSLGGKIRNLTTGGVAGGNIVYYGTDGLYYVNNNRQLLKLVKGSPQLILNGVDYASLSPGGKSLAYLTDDKFYIVENLNDKR